MENAVKSLSIIIFCKKLYLYCNLARGYKTIIGNFLKQQCAVRYCAPAISFQAKGWQWSIFMLSSLITATGILHKYFQLHINKVVLNNPNMIYI